MGRIAWAALLCGCLAAVSGCATGGGARRQDDAVKEEIRDRVDAFLTAVMSKDYGTIRSIVLPGQAQGFNAQVFVEDRFRMRVGRFDLVAWDRLKIQVTPLRDGSGTLSTGLVTVRDLAANETKPLFVNLHWRKHAGQWYIEPFQQR